MDQILKTKEYDVWLGQLESPYTFSSPVPGQEFALLLIIADSAISKDNQNVFCREIIHQGCRYAVCTGDQCSRWHDAIDLAFVDTNPDDITLDERFVMTSWHEKEPLEDVIFFFRYCTAFDYFTPQHFLVLILGSNATLIQDVSRLLKCEFT